MSHWLMICYGMQLRIFGKSLDSYGKLARRFKEKLKLKNTGLKYTTIKVVDLAN